MTRQLGLSLAASGLLSLALFGTACEDDDRYTPDTSSAGTGSAGKPAAEPDETGGAAGSPAAEPDETGGAAGSPAAEPEETGGSAGSEASETD